MSPLLSPGLYLQNQFIDMPEAKFILKEPKGNSETLIYLFYNFNYDRLKYSTEQKIHPRFWNPSKQRAKETSQFNQYPEFNQRLNKIEGAVNNAFRRLQNNGVKITSTILRAELDKELNKTTNVKNDDLIDWIEKEIEIMKQDRKKGSIQVYMALVKHLKEFSKKRKFKLTFETVDIEFYNQFRNYLLIERNMLTNTFGKQIKTLKTFLNLAVDKDVNTNLIFKNRLFKVPQEVINHIYLNSEELDSLYQINLSSKAYLDRVRDLFLIGCHTGLRFSDFTQLKKENLEETKHGYVFNVKTTKTGERVVIPVKPVVMAIWHKYKGDLPRAISNQKMNEYLKELGRIAGLTNTVTIKRTSGKESRESICPKFEFISTHTARRSFATNAYLSGVPSISIMKLTGHKTESSFMKYIKVSQERNAEMLMEHSFFSQPVNLKVV